jgi:hypothetical protein
MTEISKRETARLIHKHPGTVMRYVKQGLLPPPTRWADNGRITFTLELIEAAIEARRRKTAMASDAIGETAPQPSEVAVKTRKPAAKPKSITSRSMPNKA